MMPWLRRSTLLALLLAAQPADAQKWPVPRGPSHEPDPYRYDPRVWKQVHRPFLEDAAACVLYSATTHLVEPDGTVESIYHEITRLNGRKAVEALGEYAHITFDPDTEKLTLNEARVLKPDGRVVKIEPRHVHLRDVSTDHSVYDADRQLVISFPNLQVGDVYEVKWTTRGKTPEFEGHFFTRYSFGDLTYPIVRDEFRVRVPPNRPLKFATVNRKFEPKVRSVGKDTLYAWALTDLPEGPQDGELPSKEELRPQVMCSTFPSWEAVGRWKQKLRADCWECTPEVRKVVREVTAGLKTPAEKARALTYWVRRNVRYVSFTSARSGYTPTKPHQVLANRFGDCKDQTQLLAVMLREVGIPAALVTLGVRDDGQIVPEVPSPWGTHAILLVTIGGREHWIDTTTTLAPWDFLPRDDRDRVTYVTDDKGIRVVRTPPLRTADNRFEASTEVWVQPDGTSVCKRALSYHGLAAISKRDAWIDVPAGERRRLMAAELQDADSRARVRSLTIDEKGLGDLDAPVRAEVEFEVPGQFAAPEREGSFTDSRVWGRLLSYTLDHERKVAMDLGSPFESVHRYVIHLPPTHGFDATPADRQARSPLGTFERTARRDPKDPRRLELTYRTRLEKTRLDPADFAAFRAFHRDVNKGWRAWVSLAPAQDLDAAGALEALLAAAPADRHAAAALAKLYQKHDRPDDARRVLQLALGWNPRAAGLWELAVAGAPGLKEREAVFREMVRRFPDEPKHALSLGSTCVERGQYAAAREVLAPLAQAGAPATRAKAHFQLARAALAEKQPGDALKHLHDGRAADADALNETEPLRLEGQALEAVGKLTEATTAYRKALALSADDRDVMAAVVRLELRQGNREQALDLLRRYTLAVKGDLEGLVQAAAFHLELGRLDDAHDLARRARDIDFHAGAQRVLGLVHYHRGEFDRAVFHLDRAQPDAEVLLCLIRGHLELGQAERALAHVRTSAKFAKASPELARLCETTVKLGHRKLALLNEVKNLPAERVAACALALDALVCAEQAHKDGQPPERVAALLAKAFPKGVEIAPAYGLRAVLALERGRLGAAEADAARALLLKPGETRAHYVRGRVAVERGRLDEGLAELTKATELTGRQDAHVLHWLATGLSRAGRVKEALVAQQDAANLRPGDQEIRQQLRELEAANGEGREGLKQKGPRPTAP